MPTITATPHCGSSVASTDRDRVTIPNNATMISGNNFCQKISFVHYDLKIMCTFIEIRAKKAQMRPQRQYPQAQHTEITLDIKYYLCTIMWRSCVPIFIEVGAKMCATCAFWSILAPLAPISARCARENHFGHKEAFVHYHLYIMCTNFH